MTAVIHCPMNTSREIDQKKNDTAEIYRRGIADPTIFYIYTLIPQFATKKLESKNNDKLFFEIVHSFYLIFIELK